MSWPKELVDVLEKYWKTQSESGAKLSEKEKENFVEEMKRAYDNMPPKEKADVLVPARGSYLQGKAIQKEGTPLLEINYYIRYKWPDNPDDSFVGTYEEITLEIGEQYDRLGSPAGRYICPLSPSGKPQSVRARAVPYHIPEEDIRTSPAYHKYTVTKRYGKAVGDVVKFGKIAPVFETAPPDGGGTQIEVSRWIADLIKGDIFNEC